MKKNSRCDLTQSYLVQEDDQSLLLFNLILVLKRLISDFFKHYKKKFTEVADEALLLLECLASIQKALANPQTCDMVEQS